MPKERVVENTESSGLEANVGSRSRRSGSDPFVTRPLDGLCWWSSKQITLVLFPVLYVIGRFIHRRPAVESSEMDLKTGVDEAVADSYEEPPPRNVWERFWVRKS